MSKARSLADLIAGNALIEVGEIAASAITTAKIADDAVTGGKLANDIVINTTGTGTFNTITVGDNLHLGSDSSILLFGAGNDIRLTHVHDTGLLLTNTTTSAPRLQFQDAGEYISGDGSNLCIVSSGFTNITSTGNLLLNTSSSGSIFFRESDVNYFLSRKVGDNAIFKSTISDGDLILSGNDGGSNVDALTLDMSAAGAATFNSTVTVANSGTDVNKLSVGTGHFFDGTARISDTTNGGKLVLRGLGPVFHFDASGSYSGGSTVATNKPTIGMDGRGLVFRNSELSSIDSGCPSLFIHCNNNVGIGTDSPGTRLHVHNAGTGDGDHAYLNLTTGDTGGTATDGLTVGVAANQEAQVIFREEKTLNVGTKGNLSLKSGSSLTEHLRINTTGCVGIGTSSPAKKLHIYSNDTATDPQLLIEQDGTGDPVLGFKITDSSTCFSMGLNNSSGDQFLMSYNGTDIGTNPIFSISSTCRIGLIKTAVGGGNAKVQVGDIASFDSNVGIGTTSPSTKLHISSGVITIDDGTDSHRLGNDGCQIFFGKDALCSNNQGIGNLAFGHEAMKANVSGCYNTAVGHQALTANISNLGSYNTAHGYQALYNNTTGEKNTAVGYQSMFANTTGEYNAAIGTDSLRANTTGEQNVALGHNSLFNNTFGNGQVAAGYKSLFDNTTGNFNVALGAYALEHNVSGNCNVAIGFEVLNTNTCGDNNVAIGFKSVYSSTTALNTIGIGSCALYSLTTGNDNVAIGTNAMKAYTTGRCSVAIGNDAMADTQGQGHTNIAIGLRAGCKLASSSNIAIGLDAGSKHSASSNAGANIFIGDGAAKCITAGLQNVVIGPGVRAGTQTTLGNYNTLVGSGSAICLEGSWNVIIGNCSAQCVTCTVQSVVIGACAGRGVNSGGNHKLPHGSIIIGNVAAANYVDDGTNNWPIVAIGQCAMNASIPTAGMRTVAIGHRAMKDNTTGVNNVAIGEDAMCDNTTGRDNVSIGALSGRGTANKRNKVSIGHATAASGGGDVAIGYNAGFINSRNVTDSVNGGENVNIGQQSGSEQNANITKCNNVFVGAHTARGVSGNKFVLKQNVGIGYEAMRKAGSDIEDVTVSGNVAIGLAALCCVAGESNIGIGQSAALNLGAGNQNITIGTLSSLCLSNKNKNLAIGSNANRQLNAHCNIAIGDSALYGGVNCTGSHNIAIGLCAIRQLTTGTFNVAIGCSSMRATTSGDCNTAVGDQSMCNNTIGRFNTGLGAKALHNNTTGNQNTAIGRNSSFANTIGILNTSVGVDSLVCNTTGSCNIAIGYQAMCASVSTTDNVAIGNQSLKTASAANTSSNVAIGSCAMQSAVGQNNTVVGRCAMANATSSNNVVMGRQALAASGTVGSYNTAIGFQSLCKNTAANNTAVGGLSGFTNTTGDITAIGYYSLYANTTGDDNTAVGTHSLCDNTTGKHNVAIGYNVMCDNVSGFCNVAIGHSALHKITNGFKNVAIGRGAAANAVANSNQITAIGFLAGSSFGGSSAGANAVFIGNEAGRDITAGNVLIVGNAAACNTTGGAFSTILGPFAAQTYTGAKSTVVGASAGSSLAAGACNTLIGSSAGGSVTTGSCNTFVGVSAGGNVVGGANNIVIGCGANASSDSVAHEITLGNSSNNIFRVPGLNIHANSTGLGLGTTTPARDLQIKKSNSGGQVRFEVNNSSNTAASNGIVSIYSGGTSGGDPFLHFKVESGEQYSMGVDNDQSDKLKISKAFGVGSNDLMTITSGGDVGIGSSSPSSKLEATGTILASVDGTGLKSVGANAQIHADASSGYGALIADGASGQSSHIFFQTAGTDKARLTADSSGHFLFGTGGATERARIDSSGRMMLNTTSHIGNSSYLNIAHTYTNSAISLKSSVNVNHHAIEFHNTNGQVGFINTNGTSTVYSTSSDYRLKENVSYDFDATTRLKQLKPARFNFIADDTKTLDGFLAHEVSNVVPEAISGEKDVVQVWKEGEELPEGVSVGDNKLDEDGKTIPIYQGIDQSKLVPVLTKALQEAITKIEQLEARINTLEGN